MDKLEQTSRYLKAIADPTRLKIIELLNSNKQLCVNAIARRLNLTQSAISQHLRILRQLNLVNGNKMGYHIHYQINNDEMMKMNALFTEIILKKSE